MNIGSYLESIRKKINEKFAYKDIVVEIIITTTGVTITRDAIKHKNNIIFIDAHPLIKSEIILRKEKILTLLHEKKLPYVDIR